MNVSSETNSIPARDDSNDTELGSANTNQRERRRIRDAFRWFCFLCGLVSLLLFLFSQFGRFVFFAELLGNFRVQMILLTTFTAGLCWLGECRRFSICLGMASVWNLWLVGSIFLPATQPSPGPQTIKLMSFNVFAAGHDHQVVLQRIEEEDPDLVAIVEYDHRWSVGLAPLEDRFEYHFLQPRWHGFGVAIFSKYPLSESRVYQLIKETTDTPMLVTKVQLGSQVLRVASVHVLSPTNDFRLGKRNEQFQEIGDILSESDLPTVVMGDFNSTPWSPFLLDFVEATGYRDTRQGFGVHPSWHRVYWPLMIPIDNAFVSDAVHVHDRHVGRGSDSDHFPIVLTLSVSKEPSGDGP